MPSHHWVAFLTQSQQGGDRWEGGGRRRTNGRTENVSKPQWGSLYREWCYISLTLLRRQGGGFFFFTQNCLLLYCFLHCPLVINSSAFLFIVTSSHFFNSHLLLTALLLRPQDPHTVWPLRGPLKYTRHTNRLSLFHSGERNAISQP